VSNNEIVAAALAGKSALATGDTDLATKCLDEITNLARPLTKGERVHTTHKLRPKYLTHIIGTVQELVDGGDRASVKFDDEYPMGRYSRTLCIPVEYLRRVPA
jgi:hypothetical protein